MHVLKREAAGGGGAQAPLAVDFRGGEAGAVGLDQKASNRFVAFALAIDFGPDDGYV